MRRFLGQFAIAARITDDAGVKRRVFNPWGAVSAMEADVAPVAELVVNDIVGLPSNAGNHGLLTGLFLNLVPQAWMVLNKAKVFPPFPEYLRFALIPLSAMTIWWVVASDQRDRVAPRLFAYGRCGCCGYRLRELMPDAKGQIHCSECSACWNASRLGVLQEPPRMIGDSKLMPSGGGIFDADWNFRPVPNMRPLRSDRVVGELATKVWIAAVDSRHLQLMFLAAIWIGLAVLSFYSFSPGITLLSYLYFAVTVIAMWMISWRMYESFTGRAASGLKYQATAILNSGRCPCCLNQLPAAEGEEPWTCSICGSRWWKELRKGQAK